MSNDYLSKPVIFLKSCKIRLKRMSYKICCDKSKKLALNCNFISSLRFYKTHYEVLKLPSNCTSKEIKDAYIKLSKEHHPDINKNKQSHATFLQINEAYKVLGKPESRQYYDLGISMGSHDLHHQKVHSTHRYYDPYKDPIFWANRDRSKDAQYKNRAYYGIKGVKKFSNTHIVIGCIILTLAGLGLQGLAIFKSFTFQRDDLIRKSMEATRVHKEARDRAFLNGNEEQIKLLKLRLSGSDNILDKKGKQ